MTYRELLESLQGLTEDQLNMDVTVFDMDDDEYFLAGWFITSDKNNDVLDPDHPYLEFTKVMDEMY